MFVAHSHGVNRSAAYSSTAQNGIEWHQWYLATNGRHAEMFEACKIEVGERKEAKED